MCVCLVCSAEGRKVIYLVCWSSNTGARYILCLTDCWCWLAVDKERDRDTVVSAEEEEQDTVISDVIVFHKLCYLISIFLFHQH